MTNKQLKTLLDFYKAEVAGSRNEERLNEEHGAAVLEKDRLVVSALDTKDIDEYINELEKLIEI